MHAPIALITVKRMKISKIQKTIAVVDCCVHLPSAVPERPAGANTLTGQQQKQQVRLEFGLRGRCRARGRGRAVLDELMNGRWASHRSIVGET
jgi:hypothetical protein